MASEMSPDLRRGRISRSAGLGNFGSEHHRALVNDPTLGDGVARHLGGASRIAQGQGGKNQLGGGGADVDAHAEDGFFFHLPEPDLLFSEKNCSFCLLTDTRNNA